MMFLFLWADLLIWTFRSKWGICTDFSSVIWGWSKWSLPCIQIFSYLIWFGAFVLQRQKHKNNWAISRRDKTIAEVKSSMYAPTTEPTECVQHASHKHLFSHWQSLLMQWFSPWVELLYCQIWAGKTPNMKRYFNFLMEIPYFGFEGKKSVFWVKCPVPLLLQYELLEKQKVMDEQKYKGYYKKTINCQP